MQMTLSREGDGTSREIFLWGEALCVFECECVRETAGTHGENTHSLGKVHSFPLWWMWITWRDRELLFYSRKAQSYRGKVSPAWKGFTQTADFWQPRLIGWPMADSALYPSIPRAHKQKKAQKKDLKKKGLSKRKCLSDFWFNTGSKPEADFQNSSSTLGYRWYQKNCTLSSALNRDREPLSLSWCF